MCSSFCPFRNFFKFGLGFSTCFLDRGCVSRNMRALTQIWAQPSPALVLGSRACIAWGFLVGLRACFYKDCRSFSLAGKIQLCSTNCVSTSALHSRSAIWPVARETAPDKQSRKLPKQRRKLPDQSHSRQLSRSKSPPSSWQCCP